MSAIATLNPRPPLAPSAAPDARTRLTDFRDLTKPRMNVLVVVTTAVGYHMAAHGGPTDWPRFALTLLGTALTAAGASVLNQFVERDYDALMPRTAQRPLPAGRVRPAEALCFGVLLAATGVALLATLVNLLTASLAATTLATYLLLYTPSKRRTTLCTIIGAVPGALPVVMGFTAAEGAITPQALSLFAILFVWQMPHFLAIAILYRHDYSAGGFRMLPVLDAPNLPLTTRLIVLYSLTLIPVSLLPPMLDMTRPTYTAAALLLGAAFVAAALRCAQTRNRESAKHLFLASLLYLPVLLTAMSLAKR